MTTPWTNCCTCGNPVTREDFLEWYQDVSPEWAYERPMESYTEDEQLVIEGRMCVPCLEG